VFRCLLGQYPKLNSIRIAFVRTSFLKEKDTDLYATAAFRFVFSVDLTLNTPDHAAVNAIG